MQVARRCARAYRWLADELLEPGHGGLSERGHGGVVSFSVLLSELDGGDLRSLNILGLVHFWGRCAGRRRLAGDGHVELPRATHRGARLRPRKSGSSSITKKNHVLCTMYNALCTKYCAPYGDVGYVLRHPGRLRLQFYSLKKVQIHGRTHRHRPCTCHSENNHHICAVPQPRARKQFYVHTAGTQCKAFKFMRAGTWSINLSVSSALYLTPHPTQCCHRTR